MSLVLIVVLAILVWVALSVIVALVVGAVIARRNAEEAPRHGQPDGPMHLHSDDRRLG